VARPKQFDRDDALAAAIEVFADRGYEGTSTEALLKAMGVNRQSLYDTYGSKRELYLEALQRYARENTDQIARDIALGPTPLAGLERGLFGFIERAVGRPDPSCLGVSAICEFGLRDADVTAAGAASHAVLASAVADALERAKLDGEVRAEIEIGPAADLYLALLAGLKVSARGGASANRLRQMARLAMQALI
jgi:TetR/AcrR family transcriptional regulator, transcriptional repressor for nem operon